jgi:tetratricopeptide (TPR) repeat protein
MIELKDLLATGFYLLAVECFLKYEDRGRRRWPATATLMTLAAMLCKSTAVTLPAVLAILIWYRRGRLTWRDLAALAPVAVAALGVGLLDATLAGRNAQKAASMAPALVERIPQAGRALWFYAGKLAWPVGLSSVYPPWRIEPGDPLAWLPLVGAAAAIVFLWLARGWIGRGPLACCLFYAVTLGPTLGVLYYEFMRVSPAADRYQYLPSVGPLAGAAALATMLARRQTGGRRAWRGMPIAMMAAVLVTLTTLTWRQAALYRNNTTLFSHARDISPQSPFVYANLGVGLGQESRLQEARSALETAVRLDPDYRMAIYNLAYVLMNLGEDREAVLHLRRSVELDPGDPRPQILLAWILATTAEPQLRDPSEALRRARAVVERGDAIDPNCLNTLAAAFAATGQKDQAVATARRAQRLALERGMSAFAREIGEALRIYEQGGAIVRSGNP